jgi:hypothetical protein
MPSNQGSVMIDSLFDDCKPADIDKAAKVMWREFHNHPVGASCFCPAVEVLCALYEQGYRLVKE